MYSPRIGEEVVSPDGKVVQKITPPVVGHLPASKTTLAYIRSALQGVVTSGTAAGTFSSFPLKQVCVAGKTGTAQVFGKNSTSVFASFAPCNHPKFVVVMMIPDSGYGADVSGPGVRQIWDAIYGLQGHKAALPGGKLPALPHITAPGKIVQTTPSHPKASPKPSGTPLAEGLPWLLLPADTAVGGTSQEAGRMSSWRSSQDLAQPAAVRLRARLSCLPRASASTAGRPHCPPGRVRARPGIRRWPQATAATIPASCLRIGVAAAASGLDSADGRAGTEPAGDPAGLGSHRH